VGGGFEGGDLGGEIWIEGSPQGLEGKVGSEGSVCRGGGTRSR
jgi:hypothetical protein